MPEPLWSEPAEQGVLGAMLVDRTAPLRVAPILSQQSFYRAAHQVLFAAIMTLAERGVEVETIGLREELAARGSLETVGGLRYLAELVDMVPTAANVEYHAGIVRDYALRRELLAQSRAAAALAADTSQPIGVSLSAIVDGLVRVAHPAPPPAQTLKTELWAALGEVERQAKAGESLTGISSGIVRLDDLTDGWEKGRLIVIAARPKVGKTGLALHCAAQACRGEHATYFATAEQPRRELVKRLLAMEAGCPLRSIRSEQMLAMEAPALARAAGEVAGWPIVIDQTSRTPGQMRLGLQRHIAEHGPVDLALVDYLGKYHSGAKHERHDLEVGSMTSAFAEMAMDLDVPVILLVQLNRQSVSGGQIRRPTPSDLRDSGAIEQDAAQVLFLYRDEKADQAASDPNWLQVFVDLNRFGPTGVADVVFEKTTGRWHHALRLAS